MLFPLVSPAHPTYPDSGSHPCFIPLPPRFLATHATHTAHHPARCPGDAQGGDYKYPDYARAAPRAAAAPYVLALDAVSAAAPRRLRIPLPPGF